MVALVGDVVADAKKPQSAPVTVGGAFYHDGVVETFTGKGHAIVTWKQESYELEVSRLHYVIAATRRRAVWIFVRAVS